MKIKTFRSFCESISGTELIGHMGPNYGEAQLPVTLSKSDTEVIYSEIADKIYTQQDYDDLYHDYLVKGGKPLFGFNKENLEEVITYLKHQFINRH